MSESFNIEIISPEKKLLTDKVNSATIPSFDGEMTILSNHISLITFLRPGIVKLEKKDGKFEELFVQDGTVEFYNNTLVLLSSSAINIKNLTKQFLENLQKETEEKLSKENVNDQDRYILNHKIDIIKEIRI